MTLLRPDLVAAKGLIAIPHGLAVIATLFRLFDRHRMRRLWWDDFWAFVALLMDIPLMIAFFLRPESGSGSDVVADVILIAIPVIMMWGVLMVKQLRRLFFAIFAASILTSLASIVFVTFLFGARGWGPGLSVIVTVTSHLEAAVALLVCNILVIVTYFYRVSHEGEDLETVADANTQEATRLGDTSLAAKADTRDSSSDLESK
ncbi:hypothetical protein IMY05_C2474000200 [Salix suchowensis]|nr:hypothetical protein IMY05_C2474000200 [Salix suchowensis]